MEQINALINMSGNGLEILDILINFAFSFGLGLLLAVVYKLSYSGASYSKSFNISVMMITVITSMVMMVIGNNLALSLGMVGALSIVRFRSAIKEPKDIAYIFWGVAIGLACGAGAYGIAIIGSIVIGAVLYVATLLFNNAEKSYILVIKGDTLNFDQLTDYVKEKCKRSRIRMKNRGNDIDEIIFEVTLKEPDSMLFVGKIESYESVSSVNLVSYNGHING